MLVVFYLLSILISALKEDDAKNVSRENYALIILQDFEFSLYRNK